MSGPDERVLDRLLRLLHCLRAAAPGGLTEEQLAVVCGVVPATVRADLRLLSEYANVPVYNEADDVPNEDGWEDDEQDDGYAGADTAARPWHLDPGGYSLPPLPLAPEEAWALLEALKEIPGDSPLATVSPRLRQALLGSAEREETTAPLLVKGGRPVYDPGQPEGLIRRLEKAASLRRRLKVWYRSAAGEASERRVDPYGLLYYWVQAAWYLVGYCHQAGEVRTFRVDRLRRIQELDERFFSPPDFSLEEYFRQSWGVDRGEPHRVAVRFWDHFNVLRRVRKETAHRRDATLTPEPGGTVLYTDTIAGLNEFRVWLRSFGESAEALEPAELRAGMLESARQILERYRGGGVAL
jgi:predicted DNA-binding transcriptional regulator YafY